MKTIVKNIHRAIVFGTILVWMFLFSGGFETMEVPQILMTLTVLSLPTWRSWNILKNMKEAEVFSFFFLKKQWFEEKEI